MRQPVDTNVLAELDEIEIEFWMLNTSDTTLYLFIYLNIYLNIYYYYYLFIYLGRSAAARTQADCNVEKLWLAARLNSSRMGVEPPAYARQCHV